MTKKLLTPKALKSALPLKEHTARFIEKTRSAVQSILSFEDSRKAIIVGPCSIHSISSALAFAEKLKILQQKVEDKILLIMRCFIEKPRTKTGWKGFLYDPEIDGSHNIEKGLYLSRKLFLEITENKVPIATEFLDPLVSVYLYDLVTWGFIGARTCTSQLHRQIASHLPLPIGFKNPPDGATEYAVYSAKSAQTPHHFIHLNEEGELIHTESTGNPYTHIVLRGGRYGCNCDFSSIALAKEELKNEGLLPHLLVDCAHDNSGKTLEGQKAVFQETSLLMAKDKEIVGLVLESNLERGNQPFENYSKTRNESVSITDPCLSWEETEELILSCYQLLSNSGSSEEKEGLNSSSLVGRHPPSERMILTQS